MSFICGLIFGAVVGFLIGQHVINIIHDQDGDINVNQSGNIAGGDIVGRDKVQR